MAYPWPLPTMFGQYLGDLTFCNLGELQLPQGAPCFLYVISSTPILSPQLWMTESSLWRGNNSVQCSGPCPPGHMARLLPIKVFPDIWHVNSGREITSCKNHLSLGHWWPSSPQSVESRQRRTWHKGSRAPRREEGFSPGEMVWALASRYLWNQFHALYFPVM